MSRGMKTRAQCAFMVLLGSACLQIPLPPPPGDGGPDSGVARGPTVVSVTALDRYDREWPIDAIPRTPRLAIALSEPIAAGPSPPIFFLRGAADPELLEDLATPPLRAEHLDRAIACALTETPSGWVLDAPRLAAGETVTLAVAAWARGLESELPLGAPWVEELRVSTAPEAGAAATGSWPADGAAAVPPTIDRIAVRFDGPVQGLGGIVIETDSGVVVLGTASEEACPALGWSSGACAAFAPDAPLAASSAYVLRVGESVLDETGAPVGAWSSRFATAADEDTEPPSLAPVPCGVDEMALADLCVLADDARIDVRLQASEPVRASLAIDARTLFEIAPRGSALLSARDLEPATPYAAVLRLTDLAEHAVEIALVLATHEPLLPIAITEVRADPLGSEPAQEYVEVLNYGAVPVELEGLSISDAADAIGDVVPAPSIRIAPGQRALLVADDFDPDDPTDPVPVPAATPLVRVGRSLASGGLANGGEALYLRDALLRRISAAPAVEAPAGSCLTRAGADARSAQGFAVTPCSPGLP
jgi:hypothetical protein